uniref:Uncharacterized protein n=1 Tax=Caenorhabditis japonica TaxID=281687 RepID=A0A8R1DPM1_CAEJA
MALQVDPGKCSQQLVRYYYDAIADECKRFTFSGCGGNSNRFMRRAHCRNRCVKRLHRDGPREELKHRRTVTTTTTSTTPEPKVEMVEVEEKVTPTSSLPVTRPVEKVKIVESVHSNGLCGDCDPLYGTCVDGQCGCMKGFRSLGKVCIDLNECDNGAVCGKNARCVNEIGSFQCVCDAGFSSDGDCQIGADACLDDFDVNLTEEDCNNGKQEIKYYYDASSVECKQFWYGGCKTTSRNFFSDLQTCDVICVANQREYLKSKGDHHPTHSISLDPNQIDSNLSKSHHHYKVNLFSSPSSLVSPDRPLSADDWPLKPVTLKPAAPLGLDFSLAESSIDKETEAKKAEELIKQLTPEHNICELPFEPVLREECITAAWSEKFFWNAEFSDCEPFWYDSSCDPRDRAGKNYFETFENCKSTCSGGQAKEKEYVLPTDQVRSETESESGSESGSEPVPEIETHPTEDVEKTTTTEVPHDVSEEPNGFFFKVKPQNYLEDVEEQPVKPTSESFIIKEKQEPAPPSSSNSNCHLEYDSELRNECTSADWTELFYWNEQFKECEAFWYDSSCGKPDFSGKNLFESWHACNDQCVKRNATKEEVGVATSTPTSTPSSTTTTNATPPPTPPTTSKMLSTTESKVSEESRKPEFGYKQENPLNLILGKAISPDKSSELPAKFPPNHEKMFSNFAIKSSSQITVTTKFDRFKYMAEFRKKLLALPDGFSTPKRVETTPTTFSTVTSPTTPTTATTTTTSTKTTTTSFNDFVEAERKKVLETIKLLDRPEDLCDEPLHPKLEEDCQNDKWEIKWFFNSDRGACKSFWYGGCDVESRNFFHDHANCRHNCAHKYGSPSSSFSSKMFIPPGDFSTPTPPRKDRLTTSLRLTYPHSVDLFPAEEHVDTVLELDGNFQHSRRRDERPQASSRQSPEPTLPNIVNVSEGEKTEMEPAFYSHIDRVVHDMKQGGHPGYTKPEEFVRRIEAASNDYVKYDLHKPEVVTILDKSPPTVVPKTSQTSSTRLPTTRSINDACDDEYDPKWDEDCLGDQWVVRSYYDEKAGACKAFWYGGCHTSSRNIWYDKETCKSSCAHKFTTMQSLLQASTSSEESLHETTSEPTSSSSPSSDTAHMSTSSESLSLSQHRFKQDLDQKFADLKREHEGREDLEYSKVMKLPVTVSADCLEPFNQSVAMPCGDGKTWSNRYYYHKDTHSCQMFWSNGCTSPSKNNFDDLETCQWKCEGKHPQPAGKSCLDKFDEGYMEDCRHGEFTNRFYFDHDRKKCVEFHWGGCQAKSQNFFADVSVCQELCESPPRELTRELGWMHIVSVFEGLSCIDAYFELKRSSLEVAEACIQPFDKNYENSCSAEKPQQYYYFDLLSGVCKMFWFGNCKGDNQNVFSTLETCQWICERKREERKPAVCADKFDTKYTESCGDSQWSEKWYFDQMSGECTSFWWDGCTSTSQNIFPDEKSCTSNCKHPGFEISSKLATEDTKFRCLEAVEIGNCQETYPAFHYDRASRTCRPFAYSGCGGNANRFMTLSQCENLCYAFNQMNEAEVDCHLPMHIGFGKNDESCLPQAGFRFYYDRSYGKCSQMWYLGCGGNANNFYSYEVCQRTCSASNTPSALERKPRASSEGRPKFGIRKIRAKVHQLF